MADLPAAVYMFPVLFGLIFLGFPVAFSLIVTAVLFGIEVFGSGLGLQLFGRVVDAVSNFVLAAVPLFVFMGAMLERAGIAQRLFEAIRLWLGRLPGGLALTTIALCAVFAASSGVVGAVEIVVGLMAVPAMLSAGYRKDLAAGVVCAGGSLGTAIPPSIVVIIYASIADLSVGDLFAGVMFPALMMVGLFLGYVLIRCLVQRDAGPGLRADAGDMSLGAKLWVTATALVPAVALVFAVLGSIFAGIASPTEAAAVGAAGAAVLAAVYGRLSWPVLVDALERTVRITSMIMFIVIGGTMFASIFILNGGGALVQDAVTAYELGPVGLVIFLLVIIFILGFVLDWISIVLVAIPIFEPVVRGAGIDPVWFGVLVCVAIQTSYLTPPMAPSIFYLRAIAPPEITYMDMYKGVTPFVVAQLLTLLAVALYPPLATHLPEVLFGF